MEPSKKDWKLFRDKIAPLQELYMENLSDFTEELQENVKVLKESLNYEI